MSGSHGVNSWSFLLLVTICAAEIKVTDLGHRPLVSAEPCETARRKTLRGQLNNTAVSGSALMWESTGSINSTLFYLFLCAL